MTYRYLLWDIDNTILDFPASERYAVKTLFRDFGLGECTDEMVKMYSAINTRYWEALERGEMTKPQILVERFREFFGLIGVDPDVAIAFNEKYQPALGDHIEFMEHAEEMLRSEKGRYTLAAITNGTKKAQSKKLSKTGLDQIFDYIFISEDVGKEKPDPAYFAYVFEKMGITDRSEVLVIGDSLTSDIRGGMNAGVDTCWFNPHHKKPLPDVTATYEIDSLDQLQKILG